MSTAKDIKEVAGFVWLGLERVVLPVCSNAAFTRQFHVVLHRI